VRVIGLDVDVKIVNQKNGCEGVGNDREDFVNRDEK